MRKLLAASLVGLLVLATAGRSFADDAAKVSVAIQARYDQFTAAVDHKNWSAARAILAPEFRSIEVDGKASSADQMFAELQGLPPLVGKRGKTAVVSLRLSGDVAFVEQRDDESFGVADASGTQHSFVIASRSSDRWLRNGETWLLVETLTEQTALTLDGVPQPTRYASKPQANAQ